MHTFGLMGTDKKTAKKHRRTKSQIDEDLAIIARLRLQGYNVSEIAKKLSAMRSRQLKTNYQVGRTTVSRDLKKLNSVWQLSAMQDIEVYKGQQLAKLDLFERTAWQAFEDSKKRRTLLRRRNDEGKMPRAADLITERHTAGEAKFLNFLKWIWMQRCRMLGLETLLISTAAGKPDMEDTVPDDVKFERMLAGMDVHDVAKLLNPGADDYIDFQEIRNDEDGTTGV